MNSVNVHLKVSQIRQPFASTHASLNLLHDVVIQYVIVHLLDHHVIVSPHESHDQRMDDANNTMDNNEDMMK